MTEKKHCTRIDGKCPFSFSKAKKESFIMMAYEECYSKEIEEMLKNAVVSVYKKFKPVLSKGVKRKGSTEMYCTKVCRPIKEATFCIADLTYNNTNVGFEMGVAQELHKPVIVTRYLPKTKKLSTKEANSLKKLTKEGKIHYSRIPYKIPSDMEGFFRVDYTNEKDLRKQLKDGFLVE